MRAEPIAFTQGKTNIFLKGRVYKMSYFWPMIDGIINGPIIKPTRHAKPKIKEVIDI